MKYGFISLALVSVSLALVGCGKDEPKGRQYDNLTADQLSSFKGTMKDVSKSYSNLNSSSLNAKSNGSLFLNSVSSGLDSTEDSSAYDDLAHAIEKGIKDGSCTATESFSDKGGSGELKGSSCAAIASIKMDLNPAALNVQAQYRIQDKDMLKKIDVDFFKAGVTGKFDLKTMNVDLKASGEIHSQKNSTLTWTGTVKTQVSGNTVVANEEFDFSYKGYTVVVEAKLSGPMGSDDAQAPSGSTEEYKINGKVVSKDDVKDVLDTMESLLGQ